MTREPAATFRSAPGAPGAPGAAAARPPARTGVPGLALAGAWTATGWPATMEGAVRSGQDAAAVVLDAGPTEVVGDFEDGADGRTTAWSVR